MKRLMVWIRAIAPLVAAFVLLSVQPTRADEGGREAKDRGEEIEEVSELGTRGIHAQTAEEMPPVPQFSISNVSDHGDIEQLTTTVEATTVEDQRQQTVQASVTSITGIRLNTVDGEIDLILEASGALESSEPSVAGNAWVTDIPNARLELPGGDEFSAANPIEGIALITATNLPNNRVQIAITGLNALPAVEIRTEASGLTLSVASGTSMGDAEDDSIQIVVTGEEDGYAAPDATTATRTDTPILDIPQSIQVIPQQVLEDQQVLRLDEALANVSGVSAGANFAGLDFDYTIRGFNNVPVLRDGFRQYSAFEGQPETANLERVEVLRGPASILYGEVQPGGVINLVREQPLADPFYELEVQGGSQGLFRPQLDISGPLTSDERLLYRLNAVYFRDDGFRNYDQDYERFFVAPIVTWQIDDRTDLAFQLEYTNEQTPVEVGLPALGGSVVDVPFERIINEPDQLVDREAFNFGYDLEHRFSDNWQLRNAFRYSNQESFNNSANPLEFNEATGIASRFQGQQNLNNEDYSFQTSVVGEFATGPIDHTLLVGVDLNRSVEQEFSRFDFTPSPLNVFDPDYGNINVDTNALPVFANSEVRVNRIGIYAQDQIELLDNLILLAGVRYDTVDRTTENNPTAAEPNRSETSQNDEAWTPRVGLVYQPVPEISLYASYSESFTPNLDTTADGTPLDPERGEGFEAGVKAELLGGDLLVTLGYFDITRQNVPTTDPNDLLSSIATGEQRSRGVELDVIGEILPGWNVIGSYAYIDAEVTEDNTIPEGNLLFNTPEHSASLWTTYEIQRGDLQGLGFGVGFDFVGERKGDLANSFRLGRYLVTNAGIFYRRDHWRFALNVKNLFDIDYVASSNNSRTFGNVPGEPLTIVGSVSVEF